MKYAHVYALFLMFVFNTSCEGQSKTDLSKEDIKSETKDGITSSGPNRITRNIIQDRKGNIWIASWQGVFRYDGKYFTNITSSVSSARFFSVFEDSKGNLWFGSIGSGVYEYDGKPFKNFTTKEGLAGNGVTCIYEDKTGNIWFGTGSGASRYDGKSFRNFKIKEVPPPTDADSVHISAYQHQLPEDSWMHNDVNAIIEDKTGKLWFGTRGYAFVYDGKTFTTITNKDGKPFANVRSIIEDKKGNIWLGGYDGLWRYDGNTFTNFTRNFVGYVYEDRKGNIWTSSTTDNGQGWALSRYDEQSSFRKKTTITESNMPSKMIFGICEDHDGNIWFGSSGVYRYDGKTITDFSGTGAFRLIEILK
jgi:ligand-binding sensor domain-containing protein